MLCGLVNLGFFSGDAIGGPIDSRPVLIGEDVLDDIDWLLGSFGTSKKFPGGCSEALDW